MDTAADALSILSGVVVIVGAAYAFFEYSIRSWLRRRSLERYLKRERETSGDRGQRTLLHLMRNLRMTEAEVMRAGYTSEKIDPLVREDPGTGLAQEILFQYADHP